MYNCTFRTIDSHTKRNSHINVLFQVMVLVFLVTIAGGRGGGGGGGGDCREEIYLRRTPIGIKVCLVNWFFLFTVFQSDPLCVVTILVSCTGYRIAHSCKGREEREGGEGVICLIGCHK